MLDTIGDDRVRRALVGVVASRPEVRADARLCEAILLDLCASLECRPAVRLLAQAVRSGVAEALATGSRGAPFPVAREQWTRRLQRDLGLTRANAAWAVDSWAVALGLADEAATRTAPTAAPSPSLPPAPSPDPVPTPPHPEPLAPTPAHDPPGSARRPWRTALAAAAMLAAFGGALVLGLRSCSTARPLSVLLREPPEGFLSATRVVTVEGEMDASSGDWTGPLDVNGLPVQVRDGRFSTTVRAPADGPFEVVVRRFAGDSPQVLLRRAGRVDTTPPRIVIEEPREARSEHRGRGVRIRGRVEDETLSRVRVGGSDVPAGPDGSFEAPVALPEDGSEQRVAVEALDRAGNAAVPVVLSLRHVPAAPAWRDPLDRARRAAAAGEWERVAREVDAAKRLGASDGDVPAAVRAGLDSYLAPPALEVEFPSDGAVIDALEVEVRGRMTSGRPSDRVRVNGAPVALEDGRFRTSVRLEPGTTTPIAVTVEDGTAPRGRTERRVVQRRKDEPWKAFLGDWAEPVGTEVDATTRHPKRIRRAKDGAEMVLVPGGAFWMAKVGGRTSGESDEPEYVRVVLPKPYYLDAHEVTVGQFEQFVKATGHVTAVEREGGASANEGGPSSVPDPSISWRAPFRAETLARYVRFLSRNPVLKVTWDDATTYARWAGVELPTEAQFERALRGGREKALYPWGPARVPSPIAENVADMALGRKDPEWSGLNEAVLPVDDGFALTAPVMSFPANAFGVYDLGGNACEWCRDVLTEPTQREGPVGDLDGVPIEMRPGEYETGHAVRGGDWGWSAPYCHTRSVVTRDGWTQGVGFRGAMSLP